jgi:benzoyl-CoA reductase/2-hydroxyglutaryl-CoA dehydratase subunit BcrC/BadD/HgdB
MKRFGNDNFRDFNKLQYLNKSLLIKIKHKALRLKIWYKLNNIERTIIDLTIKCVDEIKSIKLRNIILKILNKIKEAIENNFLNKIYENGLKEIVKIIKIAYSWGNKESLKWIKDKNFILYLGIKNIYTPNIWRI